MKEVNQLVHLTEDFESLISIIENGIHSSYAQEVFCGEKILIPMISFSNLLFRDIGETEIVNYGSYGIGIERQIGIEFDLNPVVYVYENNIIENGIKNGFEFSILPQVLDEVKEFYKECKCDKITDHINFKPLPAEVKDLLNSISEETDDKLIKAIKNLFGRLFENSYRQILLAKPYKVVRKDGTEFFAYNEREWRKSFFDLHFIKEKKPNGKVNDDFEKFIKTSKPHLKDEAHTLKIPVEKIKFVIVKDNNEISTISKKIIETFGEIPKSMIIDTLDNLKKKEK